MKYGVPDCACGRPTMFEIEHEPEPMCSGCRRLPRACTCAPLTHEPSVPAQIPTCDGALTIKTVPVASDDITQSALEMLMSLTDTLHSEVKQSVIAAREWKQRYDVIVLTLARIEDECECDGAPDARTNRYGDALGPRVCMYHRIVNEGRTQS